MISLKKYSTFRTDVSAQDCFEVKQLSDIATLRSLISRQYSHYLIVGGGSNIVFVEDFDGLIVHNCLKGKEIIQEDQSSLVLKIASGENRNTLVQRSIDYNLVGIENLIMIPGTVGGAPVQNIGAYGVEIRESLISVEGVDLATGEIKNYTNEECEFGYRDSIFKHTLKQGFFITSLTIRLQKLTKQYSPRIGYANIDITLLSQGRDGSSQLHPKDIAQAISILRQSKLPDPQKIGTVGSFFQNPIITKQSYTQIKHKHSELHGYINGVDKVKLSAGQLIELCDLKGYRTGDIGTYPLHALVLVNYGEHTSGEEVAQLIHYIQDKVQAKFGIQLIPEVNIISSGHKNRQNNSI